MLTKIIHNNYFFSLSLLFLVWFVMSDNLAKAVGSVFPVTSKFQVEEVFLYSPESIRLTGDTVKNYNCDFTGIRWYLNSQDVKVQVPSFFVDSPQARSKGDISLKGIVVGVTPDKLQNLNSVVIHECALGIKVITDFYGD